MEILVCTSRKIDQFLKNKKCKVFSLLQDCINEKPDFAIISNETSLHVKTALQLARAGIHFLAEKPLSHNMKGMSTLLDLVTKKKLITLMGCDLRFHPCILKIKELVNQKKIGRIISVSVENGSYLPEWHPYENYRMSYASRKELGGGVALTCIHELDYLYWIFGKVQELFSITGKFSDLQINTDDLSSILLRFKEGIIAEVHLDYYQRPGFRSCKVIGTKGTIYWNSDTNSVKIYDVNKKQWIEKLKLRNYDDNDEYIKEIQHFIKCVKKKGKSINTVHEGVETLKIALAAKKASEMKRMVKLT